MAKLFSFNEVLFFTRKKDTLKKASKSVCISGVVVIPDSLSPVPSTSSSVKTPQTTEEDADDP
jgi:hypothetical protein